MMRIFAALLLVALPVPALAQPAGEAPPPRPDITVRGPERLVCRPQVRTATRMRTSRVCRTESEARSEADRVTAGSYDEADSAYFRGSGTFEPCPYGVPPGPLGPR